MPYGPVFLGRRRRRAGDGFFSNLGLDDLGLGGFDPTVAQDAGSSDTPDFSDVVGGSSTAFDPGDIMSAGLTGSGISNAISQFLGGPGSNLGPAISAGSGLYGALSPSIKKAARAFLGGRSRRRMNPGNFRALRRAMHRLTAFERAARHVIKFTHPKPNARVKFKFRRRRRK